MIALSLIAVVYIGLVALVQADMKKLIAYSSISHMGFVTLGFFLFNADGMVGGLIQMISHGFISAAMFLCVGVLYDRVHSREIADYGGVVNTMPVFAAFFVLFAMANSGLPGTSGFVGEFMVILGTIKVNFWYAFLAATTLIFGAAYTLWMDKRVIYGEVANDERRRAAGREPARVRVPRAARGRGALDGRLAEALRRRDEPLHPGAAAPRRAEQALSMNTATFSLATLAPAIPEIVLLALRRARCWSSTSSCASEDRHVTYWLAIVSLVGTRRAHRVDRRAARRWSPSRACSSTTCMSQVLKVVTLPRRRRDAVLQPHVPRGARAAPRRVPVPRALRARSGMMVMISAHHFLTLYLGLELMALSLYAMVALQRDSARATEAAMKYFVLGALASGLLLYGMSMIYGATGSLELTRVAQAHRARPGAPARCCVFGLVFVVAGIAFKLGAVPVPHVDAGRLPRRATPVTLFIGTAPKIAAFAFICGCSPTACRA